MEYVSKWEGYCTSTFYEIPEAREIIRYVMWATILLKIFTCLKLLIRKKFKHKLISDNFKEIEVL